MKNKFKNLNKKILWYLPPKFAHKILYKHRLGKSLNLKEPIDFNEKIQWLILNRYDKYYADLADKFKVRNFIEEKGYGQILPKLYGVYDDFSKIDFNKLPDKFVLKPNNGCGGIFIFDGKDNVNLESCKKTLNSALKENFAINNLEYHYSFIEPKIICEEYLDDKKNKLPLDYKFYCYNGKVECILMCSNRDKQLKLDYYDLDWNYLDYAKEEYRSNKKYDKPDCLKEMIDIASDLSKGFEFVRVDLYSLNGKIYFGELTFTPAAGLVQYNTPEALNYLGSLIKLEK